MLFVVGQLAEELLGVELLEPLEPELLELELLRLLELGVEIGSGDVGKRLLPAGEF
jgi:hypothetical protein